MNMHHKLDLHEFDEIDYYLIIYILSLEDYRLAVFINQKTCYKFSKSKRKCNQYKEGETNLPAFIIMILRMFEFNSK
jgi:hypothetical protein